MVLINNGFPGLALLLAGSFRGDPDALLPVAASFRVFPVSRCRWQEGFGCSRRAAAGSGKLSGNPGGWLPAASRFREVRAQLGRVWRVAVSFHGGGF